jgi:hypothetical protein
MWEKTESIIDNPETLATLGTQDKGWRQTKHNIHQNPGVNPGACEGQAVPTSYKTPTMLLIQSISFGHHYTQTNTNNVNKTWATYTQLAVKW